VQAARELGKVYPQRTVCALLGVARSSVRYGARPGRNLEPLCRVIQANRVTFPTFGFRRMYKLLVRQSVACTRSEVYTSYKQLRILGKRAPARVRTTDSRHEHERYPNLVKDLAIIRPDQVWVADVLELRVARRRAFLALVEDVYTRRVMGFGISFANNSFLNLDALEMGLRTGVPEIHHSDQGKTYASDCYTKRLLDLEVLLSMAAAGCAWENGYAERLNRTFRQEEIVRSEYDSIQEARAAIGAYVKLYNELRIHQSLGYQTPHEVKEAHGKDQAPGE
jgi:putative transposase